MAAWAIAHESSISQLTPEADLSFFSKEYIEPQNQVWAERRGLHARLLRDIFPNPFRLQPTIDPVWQKWNDGTIVKLAQQMYDSRDFMSMPILADALEEAGCTSADILEHCRGPGPHVRGCWVVDLVLEKE